MLGWKGNYFPTEKRRHIYVIFDDGSWGYSIRKMDLSVGDSGDGEYSTPPAFFKLHVPPGGPKSFVGDFDSSIFLAMQPMDYQFFSLNPMAGVPIYDVHKPNLMVGPICVLVGGGRLFALAAGSFQLLYPPPDEPDDEEEDFVWKWHTLPSQREHVASYAMHRVGRTIFVSTSGESPATFRFDTAESVRDGWMDGCMWKQLSQRQLPFYGRAYFFHALDAWVGLSGEPGTTNCHLCSMDALSDKWDNGQTVSSIDVISEHELGGSKFCVVECCLDGCSQATFIRLVTFSLTYDKNGRLPKAASFGSTETFLKELVVICLRIRGILDVKTLND